MKRSEDEALTSLLQNVRIEIITEEEIANKIATEVAKKFFKNYAGILYTADVKVIE